MKIWWRLIFIKGIPILGSAVLYNVTPGRLCHMTYQGCQHFYFNKCITGRTPRYNCSDFINTRPFWHFICFYIKYKTTTHRDDAESCGITWVAGQSCFHALFLNFCSRKSQRLISSNRGTTSKNCAQLTTHNPTDRVCKTWQSLNHIVALIRWDTKGSHILDDLWWECCGHLDERVLTKHNYTLSPRETWGITPKLWPGILNENIFWKKTL